MCRPSSNIFRTNFQHKETNNTDTTLYYCICSDACTSPVESWTSLWRLLYFIQELLTIFCSLATLIYQRCLFNHNSQFSTNKSKNIHAFTRSGYIFTVQFWLGTFCGSNSLLHCVFEIPPQILTICSQFCLRLLIRISSLSNSSYRSYSHCPVTNSSYFLH